MAFVHQQFFRLLRENQAYISLVVLVLNLLNN